MTGFDHTPRGHEDLGAYLLGGLSDGERIRFEEHLTGCAACRDELVRLGGLPARLGALSAGEANVLLGGDQSAGSAPAAGMALPVAGGTQDSGTTVGGQRRPGEVWLRSLHEHRRHIRRRALRLAAAVAIIAAAAGGAIGYLAGSSPDSAAPVPAASYKLTSERGVQARVDFDKKAWGTELSLTAADLPTTGVLELWVLDDSGRAERVGSWTATTTGKSAIICPVPVQLPLIERVQVRSGARSVLAEVHLPTAEAR